MKKKLLTVLLAAAMLGSLMTGCGENKTETAPTKAAAEETKAEDTKAPETEALETRAAETEGVLAPIPDGVYLATFNTDSSMFHINETCDGKGTLTVKDGAMIIHITLASKKIEKVFLGSKEDAKKEDAVFLTRTEDEVVYDDGDVDTAYGFDVPVEALDTEFLVSIIGTHGNWYEHKVSVTDPEPKTEP